MRYAFEVGSYSLTIQSVKNPLQLKTTAAVIVCHSHDLKTRASLAFVDGPLWENSVQVGEIVDIKIALPAERYGWCADILRNERPISVVYFDDQDRFYLYTSDRQATGGEGPAILTGSEVAQ
jgi:hypothetical protein